MSMGKHSGNGAGRKPGDWKNIANSRARIPRDLHRGTGLSNVPKIGETGSAAYRRLMKTQKSRGN